MHSGGSSAHLLRGTAGWQRSLCPNVTAVQQSSGTLQRSCRHCAQSQCLEAAGSAPRKRSIADNSSDLGGGLCCTQQGQA